MKTAGFHKKKWGRGVAQNIYYTFKLSEDSKQYDKVNKKYEEYCKPLRNQTYERFKL